MELGYVDDDDEEESLEDDSGAVCSGCGDSIKLSDEVFLLKVCAVHRQRTSLKYSDLLGEEGVTYAPHFFCFDCWEAEKEKLEEIHEDTPPIVDGRGILVCNCCSSDVLPQENVGVVMFGELHRSKRSPDGDCAVTFVQMDECQHVCAACLHILNEEQQTQLWSKDVRPIEGAEMPCVDDLFARAWRRVEERS